MVILYIIIYIYYDGFGLDNNIHYDGKILMKIIENIVGSYVAKVYNN